MMMMMGVRIAMFMHVGVLGRWTFPIVYEGFHHFCWVGFKLTAAGWKHHCKLFHAHYFWWHRFVVGARFLAFFKNGVFHCCLCCAPLGYCSIATHCLHAGSLLSCMGYLRDRCMAVWLYEHPTSLNVNPCIHLPSLLCCCPASLVCFMLCKWTGKWTVFM